MVQLAIFDSMAWIYSTAWSLSFYGQICENFRLKNVYGMSLNFMVVNIQGFAFYAIYNLYGFLISSTQTGQVVAADLLFSLHALAATLFTAFQSLIYPRGQNIIYRQTWLLIVLQWLFLLIYFGLIKFQIIHVPAKLGVISMIGYCKILATCYKYLPQVRWNYIRKTTKGWSIFNVLMDLTGGIFSFSEIILRGAFIDSYQINISKFLLGTLTIVYDVVFLFQHYYFYPNKEVIPMPQSTSITMDSPSQNNQLGLEIQ